MTTFEQDPDVVCWGLHLLTGDPYSNNGYCASDTPHAASLYNGEYAGECPYELLFAPMENDPVTTHYIQEEPAELSAAEASRSSYLVEEHSQLSDFSQDWLALSMRNINLGCEGVQEEDDMESSSSSPGEKSYYGDWSDSLEIHDDHSTWDGEVGKRLYQMVPVPHVPRTNGEIPSIDEATSDHQRLLERLHVYDLVEFKVLGDGNCQFRALSDQFYRTPEHHKFVKEQIINQLKFHREIYEGYVPMAYDDYLNKLSQDGEWGDHVTLQAAADSYGVKIFVITSFKDTCYIEILPNVQKSRRVIFLSFWAEVHYNSIYPEWG